MGFVHFKNALRGEAVPQDFDVAYVELAKWQRIYFSSEDFFYFEILGDNYHTEPIIGFAWGNEKQIYASTDTDLLKSEAFQAALSKAVNIYDFKRSKVLLSHLGIDLPTANFDARWPSICSQLLRTMNCQPLLVSTQIYHWKQMRWSMVRELSVPFLKKRSCSAPG